MASPRNRHCANCIGTLSSPIDAVCVVYTTTVTGMTAWSCWLVDCCRVIAVTILPEKSAVSRGHAVHGDDRRRRSCE